MAKVVPGRYTAQMGDSFVVFIIGMRVNKFWAVHKWWPVMKAMPKMLKELYSHPELGFLHSEYLLSWRGVTLIQYWKSFDDLEKYARGGVHLKEWQAFNRSVGTDGTVGIFHETYLLKEGQYECVYGNMPRMGLGAAGEHVPATGKRETARRRTGGTNDPAVPTPPNPGV